MVEAQLHIFSENLSLSEATILVCLSGRRRMVKDILGRIQFELADPSIVEKTPKIYSREYIGKGDEHLEETVSFILKDGGILSDIVPQEQDCYVDEAVQTPYKKPGIQIKQVLSDHPDVRLVVIHTWDFDGSLEPIKDIDTISVLEI